MKISHKDISFFLVIFNIPVSCSLSKEFHEAPLHHEPNESWEVEEESQEHQVDWHPLVIRIVNNGNFVG